MTAPTEEEVQAAKAVLAQAGDNLPVEADEAPPTADELAAIRAARATKANAPKRFRVIVSNKMAGDRVLFTSVSERRTHNWVEAHCPRGSHFFVRGPDGTDMSYEHERLTGGPRGEDVEAWQPFDREAYQAPDLSPVDSNDPWADAWEGAQ